MMHAASAQSTSASNQTTPTVLDHYCQYLDRAERYRDLDPQTLSTLHSHLRKMAHLFEISAQETLDINSEVMLGLLEQTEVLFATWAVEGKAHHTILDYQRLFVEVNFNLEEDAVVESGPGTGPILRHAADRFTQRIGGGLNSIRPVGPPVAKHGATVDCSEGDDFKENGWFGGGMTPSRQKGVGAEGRISNGLMLPSR